jgi:hypothetical protein
MPAAAREASAAPEDLSHDLLVTVFFMMDCLLVIDGLFSSCL